jgi:hypothetical protein
MRDDAGRLEQRHPLASRAADRVAISRCHGHTSTADQAGGPRCRARGLTRARWLPGELARAYYPGGVERGIA